MSLVTLGHDCLAVEIPVHGSMFEFVWLVSNCTFTLLCNFLKTQQNDILCVPSLKSNVYTSQMVCWIDKAMDQFNILWIINDWTKCVPFHESGQSWLPVGGDQLQWCHKEHLDLSGEPNSHSESWLGTQYLWLWHGTQVSVSVIGSWF